LRIISRVESFIISIIVRNLSLYKAALIDLRFYCHLISDLANSMESPVNREKSRAAFGYLSKYLFLVKNSSSAISGVLIIKATVLPTAKPTMGGTSFFPLKKVASTNSLKGCPLVLSLRPTNFKIAS
jgi:hypothetical protein